ncbi:transcriptional regulator, XRE family [Ammonifex degensii KC4]|uniref:Transcriptional regulator, XRE family n=1 Tax=Ammonifex degensii (strain DSM 10501 / KC4) TaxID=429009 RepID=C9RAL6_AMMDK|nr:helix-turn-helix transcriptional regulator [Ammonifex degensii]ACX51293.1 transcriptional regulator, XRE family [Ammonifex degensii KC4]
MRSSLRKARLRAGLTQSEVARLVGLTRASYTNIERGHKNPSVVTALRIAQVLNRSVEELFSDEPPAGQAAKREANTTMDKY